MKAQHAVILLIGFLALAACKEPRQPEEAGKIAKIKNQEVKKDAIKQGSRTSLTLPPENAPLRSVEAQLKQRAANGDAGAACRLAVEYDYCSSLSKQMSSVNAALLTMENSAGADGDAPGEDNSPEILNALLRELKAKEKHCSGVSLPTSNQRLKYWREAASAGNVAAMIHYSTGRAFSTQNLLQNLSELGLYKELAPELIQKAARAGSVDAILALARAHSPIEREYGFDFLMQIVEADAKEALTFYYLARDAVRLGATRDTTVQLKDVDREISKITRILPAHDISDAAREANSRKAAWAPLTPDLQTRGYIFGNAAIMPDQGRCSSAEYSR